MVLSFETASRMSLVQAHKHRAWIEIDRAALRYNVQQIKAHLNPKTQLMAVVKADAYGHGAVKVAKIALEAGATWCAVATLGEGIELREAGITAPILILGAVNSPQDVEAIAFFRLQPTISSPQQALIFSETLAINQTLPVHLKIDTGMSRLGTLWTEALAFGQFVARLPNLQIASVYSHFATADDPDPTLMQVQHQRFLEVIAQFRAQDIHPQALHIANSAALMVDRTLHYDFVRAGLALYGLYPAPHLRSILNLRPVLQVKARITQVKTVPAGTGVSYGHRYICDRETRIAIVSIGYADGVPRLLSNLMKVLLRGQIVPQIGSITMDQLMIDVSTMPDVQPEEVVTLIGQDGDREISADDWAELIGTISWEILCGFKARLPRI